ncbi:hypothetical protein OS493_034362 [Desmophyllum pertusum]|uniref:Uncharacterized protein n=1 Tax=Desmophyllum pertusum TaxID=174260 RepID=A0A9W9ZZP6_9CNID|nr:hypothetical protein OS493_034362 [Desmophyllum pertusum]
MDESDALITPEEMVDLKASKPYVEGIKAIKEAGEGKELSQQEFTLARDVLLVRFAVDNATRPGPLNNARLADYEKADTAKGKKIMLVARHKRAKDGPAILGMMPDLQELMELYIRKNTFKAILPEIKGWRSTVDGCTQDKQNQRYMDESDALITPEEMVDLKASKPYVEGIKAIKEAGEGKELSQQEFTLARDVLLVRFAVDNATRPGPLNNARLADYEKADTAKGKKIMLVARHKRAKDGPAILGMMPDLQELMELYIRKVRPQFAKAGVDHLFVMVEGTAFPRVTSVRSAVADEETGESESSADADVPSAVADEPTGDHLLMLTFVLLMLTKQLLHLNAPFPAPFLWCQVY